MAIIDQRILIPARQEVVWAYLSDLSRNPEWQADCTAVSFLSTRHDGTGTRWRSSGDKGKDSVLEITSWYNGLGYEYVYVDGAALKDNKGRLRLQEIPEGTVVQWTFSFDGGGLFGGGKVRQLDATMAASLKALYKQIKTLNQEGKLEARSLMRDAPDVEARAAYKPRHAPQLSEGASGEVSEGAVLLPVSEPDVQADDAAFVPAVDLSAEPPVAVEDTKPRPAVAAVPADDARFAPPPEPQKVEPSEPTAGAAISEAPAASPEPVAASAREPEVPEPAETGLAAEPPVPDRTAAAVAAAVTAAQLPPADPQGKSIWEVFGMPRPAEIEAAPAATEPAAAPPEPPSAPVAEASVQTVADPQETVALDPVTIPNAVVIPAVVVEPTPNESAPVEPPPSPVDEIATPPDTVVESAAGTAVAAPPRAPVPRQGLRVFERRQLVKLRRPN
jgi:hypothetical protein